MKILSGHVSPETAYQVNDYPYGFRLRCMIRYWLEYKPNNGFRLISQTSNPRHVGFGVKWNAPKGTTYARFGGCMVIIETEDRVTWVGLTEYSDAAESIKWRDTYGAGCPNPEVTDKWINAKVAYEERLAKARLGSADDLKELEQP